jgi:hypothetical protein
VAQSGDIINMTTTGANNPMFVGYSAPPDPSLRIIPSGFDFHRRQRQTSRSGILIRSPDQFSPPDRSEWENTLKKGRLKIKVGGPFVFQNYCRFFTHLYVETHFITCAGITAWITFAQ